MSRNLVRVALAALALVAVCSAASAAGAFKEAAMWGQANNVPLREYFFNLGSDTDGNGPFYPAQTLIDLSGAPIPVANASVAVNVATATTTELVAAVANKAVTVSAILLRAAGADVVTFEYGTKTTNPCDTGATALTGAMTLGTAMGAELGGGLGGVLFVPAGKELCVVTSAAVQLSGLVSYVQQ